MKSGLESPEGVWWKPVHRSEKIWFGIAFAWCIVLFAMMPLWHWKGGQNPAGIRSRVDPAAYQARVEEFIAEYKVGEENGFPIVEPPPGSDVYLLARMWSWTPILKLRKGVEYTLHLSSLDVGHGFGLYPVNVNFQIVPGYDYGLRVTPSEAGDFRIICNEFCGIGHHLMLGKVIVVDDDDPPADAAASAVVSAAGAPSDAAAAGAEPAAAGAANITTTADVESAS